MFDAEKLVILLNRQDMRQAELARRSGITRNLICRYMTGQIQPKADKIEAMAKVLGVSVEALTIREAATEPKMKVCYCPNCGVNLEGVIKASEQSRSQITPLQQRKAAN